MTPVTRFAPSPTGKLHLGHAFSAVIAWRWARKNGGRFLLRIEDIDPIRCRPEHSAAIIEDLRWLGLDWDGPVRQQSRHMDDYRAALDQLDARGVLYPCFCSRADIARAIERSGLAPHAGEGSVHYPGTCRILNPALRAARLVTGSEYAIRIDMAKAAAQTGPLQWRDLKAGTQTVDPVRLDDVVLARRDVRTSYHLSVTVDDALQGVTLVTRGQDLFPATPIHRVLQALLALPVPDYAHHPLLTNEQGQRLSKRDGAKSLAALRADGLSPADILAVIGPAANREILTNDAG